MLLKTKVRVIDNSGAKWAKCIFVLNKHSGQVGDLVVVNIVKIKNKQQKIKKGDVCLGLIVRTKQNIKSTFGHLVSFNDTSIILVKRDLSLIGSRIKGLVSSKLRRKGFLKVLLLADGFL